MFSLGMICPWYVVDFYHASSLGILFFTSRYKWYEFGGRISPHYGCLQWTYCIYLHDIYVWLVVSNMAFIFHNIWDVILPIDFHIFQDGEIAPPTSDVYWVGKWVISAWNCQMTCRGDPIQLWSSYAVWFIPPWMPCRNSRGMHKNDSCWRLKNGWLF